MSYVVGSLHPPSLITSVTTADIGCDILILSRGNEILISDITDKFISKPKIYQFFGNISSINSFDTNKLAILFDTEKLLTFYILPDQIRCYHQCSFNYRIGRKVPTFQLSASNTLIVCHTRLRTIQLILLDRSLSFTQYLPFTEINTIKCFDDSFQFIVFGKNFNNSYQVVLYEINDKKVIQVNSISFAEFSTKPSILIESQFKFYISINDKVELVENFENRSNYYLHNNEIKSLFKINDTISLFDSKNKVFNITNKNEMITLAGIHEVVPIGHDFFFETSLENDAHLLKFENFILKVYDTFAQLNCTSFMDRSQLVTKSGTIRSFVNGSATAEQMVINVDSAKSIWSTNRFIIISTFDSTIVLESSKFSEIESHFVEDAETISVIEVNENKLIQITPNQIRLLEFGENETFSDIYFDGSKTAILASNFDHAFAIAFSDRSVSLYSLSDDESDVILSKSLNVKSEVSSVAMNDRFLSVSFWQQAKIQTFDLTSLEPVGEVKLNSENEFYVSSLLYEDEVLFAGCSNGEVAIVEQGNRAKTVRASSSSIKLRKVQDRILIISDVSSFLHKSGGHYSIEFIAVSASFDAAEFMDRIAFLTSKGAVFLSIESSHHSHIEDRSVVFNTITMISVDETNHCPTVYAVKSESKNKSGPATYTLFATGCQPAKMTLEIPKCMVWLFHNSEYFLAVGCEIEKSGRLILFNSKLERVSTANLTNPIDAICSVLNIYIAVASGTTLKGYLVDAENNLVCKCTEQTRVKCASLTSPNSFAVVYADRQASASIYKMCDDQIALIASDMNPKALKFARLESETDVLAIGDNSILYDLELVNGTKLKTKAAFDINCDVNAVFSSPNLAFITKSGSLQVIMKKDEIFVKIFNVMKKRVRGIGGLSIDELRTVEKNGNSYDTGCFVDGDFICLFNMLSDAEQLYIAKAVGIDVNKVKEYIKKYMDDIVSYREKIQTRPSF